MKYNDKQMKSITVDGARVSTYHAIRWAVAQFGSNFSVQHEFPGEKWRFTFKEPKHATLFALKWHQ